MQLEIQDSINPDSVFHLCELHIIFDYLKVIGNILKTVDWTKFSGPILPFYGKIWVIPEYGKSIF